MVWIVSGIFTVFIVWATQRKTRIMATIKWTVSGEKPEREPYWKERLAFYSHRCFLLLWLTSILVIGDPITLGLPPLIMGLVSLVCSKWYWSRRREREFYAKTDLKALILARKPA